MNKTKFIIALIFYFSLMFAGALFAQNTLVEISGQIKDEKTGEPLVGVALAIKGTVNGTITDENGNFKLRTKLSFPFTLSVSYLGYEAQEYTVSKPDQAVSINLNPQSVVTNDVVVSASRVEENILKSPVAIEKLDIRTLRESPSPSFYDALENVKGVQMVTSSLTFKVPNARGFNIPNNFRFMQLVDGTDMQSATLGVPLGNTVGPSELDIESVEITPGASSALYGMNAINGQANMITKSPFRYQGLSVYQKAGVNHIDSKDRNISPLTESAIRYAWSVNNKFAFKINGSYMGGVDWVSNSTNDQNDYSFSNPKFNQFQDANNNPGNGISNNPAYDAWNKYGDESNNNLPVTVNYQGKNQTFNVRRTGYFEKDLVPASVRNIKFDGAIHYRITEKLEASYSYRIGLMDGTFQRGNKIRLQDATVQIHKLELKSPELTIRTYLSQENTGKSYNLKPLADNLELNNASNAQWSTDYRTVLQNELNGGIDLVTAHQDARSYADRNRAQPGSGQFNDSKNTIVNVNNWDHGSLIAGAPATGGAALWQKSNMYNGEVLYDFSKFTGKYVDILAGVDGRIYEVYPDGNNFVDLSRPINERTQPGGNNLYYSKLGGFAQVTKRLLNDNLKLIASVRYDKNMKFDGKWNPRFAVVYTAAKDHNFRLSVQNGYRFPSLFEALSYVNNGNVRRVGSLPEVNEGLGYLENSYTLASINEFNNAVNSDVANGQNRNQAALSRRGILVESQLKKAQPENITSFEFGYKSILLNNNLVLDYDIYYNIYQNFFGQVDVAVPNSDKVGTDAAVLDMLSRNNQSRYRVYTNAKNTYNSYGSGLRVSYYFINKFNISGNVNYNTLVANNTPDVFVTGFNTPKWATMLSFGNREIVKNLGFSVVWKWQDGFLWESPLATGVVSSFNTFDAQVSLRVPKLFAIIKGGGSNIFNQRYIQYAAGPTIGALYYVSVTFDGLLTQKANK
ncbi:MAG: TonB-dependent receptor [Bacteroidota bacterium]|nr:TonB-dependent receptor [Bacteroidota bacterium]